MTKVEKLRRDFDKKWDAAIAAHTALVKHLRTVGEDTQAEKLLIDSRLADHHASSAGKRWRDARRHAQPQPEGIA